MKQDNIYKLLALSMSLSSYDDFLLCDEKLMGYSVNLVIQINDLLDEGYTKEEIYKMIEETNFKERIDNLSDEEAIVLKNEAFRLLEIRYDIYVENNDIKKRKKDLFNK